MNNIKPNDLIKIKSIFESNNWNVIDIDESVFNKYCKLLSNLDKKQQDLIIELSERYTWISYNEYLSANTKIFNYVESNFLESPNKVILFPIMKPDDEKQNKTKSSHVILYLMSALFPSRKIKYTKKETFDSICNSSISFSNNDYILLVDDYIGTGTTLNETINELYNRNNTIKHTNIIVLSIVIQEEAMNYLKENKIKYYNILFSKKGITDYYKDDKLSEKIRTMEEIEKILLKNNYQFGYKRSEALFTLIKTPNNTFPIFWHDYSVKSKIFKAPFSRY